MKETLAYLENLKESSTIELKEGARKVPSSLFETYSSFSNTSGGTIYLGIKEGKKNEIIGIENAVEQKRNLISSLHSKEKVSYCSMREEDVSLIDIDGKIVMKIVVPKAPKEVKPVYINKNLSLSYERIGDGDFLLNEEAIATLLSERRGIGFDMMKNPYGFSFSHVDLSSLHSYRDYLNLVFPSNIYRSLSDHDFMLRIGAMRDGEGEESLTNGGLLFFGYIDDIRQLVPNYQLDYIEKIGDNKRWDYRLASDDLSNNCNLWTFFSIVSERIIKGLPNPFKTNGVNNLDGEDIKRAVIEGVSNAIANQNYPYSPALSIKKTPNNVVIVNSGDMGVSFEQAKAGGISDPRNKNIMNYLRIIGVADRAGTGIPNIYDVFASYHFLPPSLKVKREPLRTELKLNFLSLPSYTPYRDKKLRILSYLDENEEGASLAEIASLIDKKNTVASQIMSELMSLGYIKTNGKKTKGKKYFKNED